MSGTEAKAIGTEDKFLNKAESQITNRGGFYSANGGDSVPDAPKVQKEANDKRISTEIIFDEQTDDYAKVIVRAHDPEDGHYVDAIVNHNFKVLFQKKAVEYLEKQIEGKNVNYNGHKIKMFVDANNPFDEDGNPITTPKGTIKLLKDMLNLKNFASRDATTKAMRAAQYKLLNKDWREKEEVQAELDEVKAVTQEIEERKEEKQTPKPPAGGKDVDDKNLIKIFDISPDLEKLFGAVIDQGEVVPLKNLLKETEKLLNSDKITMEQFREIKKLAGIK
jgi:hypothetical protein